MRQGSRPGTKLTPHPVLASFKDDYVNATFASDISCSQQAGDLYLTVHFTLEEETLMSLIDKGMAAFAVHIECRASSFRLLELTGSPSWSRMLYRTDIWKKLTVDTYIVATQDIHCFDTRHFHPDYDDLTFEIGRGDVLAVGSSVEFDITTTDDLARHSSVLTVSRAPDTQKDALAVNTDQPTHVLITLKSSLYDVYVNQGSGDYQDLMLSLVVLPALAAVLTRMHDGGDDLKETEWYQSIAAALAKNKLTVSEIDNTSNDRSALAMAQQILSQPLMRSMTMMGGGAES